MGIIILFKDVFKPIINLLPSKRIRSIYFLLILVLFSAFAEVAIIGFLYQTLSDGSFLNFDKTSVNGVRPQLAFIGSVIVATFLRLFCLKYQFKISANIGMDFSTRLLSTILNKDLSWHIKNNSALSLSLITRDTEQLVAAVQSALTFISNLILTSVLFLGLVIILKFLIVYVLVLLLVYYLIIYSFTKSRINKNADLMTSSYAESLRIAQESLGGIRDTILSATQDFYLKQFINHTKQYRYSLTNIQFWQASPRYLVESFILILFLLFIIFSSSFFSNNNSFIPVVGALITGAYRLLSPIQQSFISLTTIEASTAAIKKLNKLKIKKENTKTQNTYFLEKKEIVSSPKIELKNTTFSYDNIKNVVENINITIPPSTIVAIAGISGSGKSTLADLILGLISPTSGDILFDGQKDPRYLRENIWPKNFVGIVPQEIFLFDGDLYQNVTLEKFTNNSENKKFERAIKLSMLDDLVSSNKKGKFLNVGERGDQISGGQKQRIGIARAIYRNHKLLILDESTSALDSYTERSILNNLKKLCEEESMTIILISHRLRTLRICDEIFFIENGNLKSNGNFETLCEKSENFRNLIIDQ